MFSYLKKHIPQLPAILLILMLAVPFVLYYFAKGGSIAGVKFFLVIMGVVMLVAMKK